MKKIVSLLTLTLIASGVPAYGMFRGLTKAVSYPRMSSMRMRSMSNTTQTPHRMKRLVTSPWVTVGSLFGLGGASAYAIRTLNNEIDALESVNGTLTEKVVTLTREVEKQKQLNSPTLERQQRLAGALLISQLGMVLPMMVVLTEADRNRRS